MPQVSRPGDGALRGLRVLVRLPSWLGDCVAVEPALRRVVAATDDGRRLSIVLPDAFVPLFRAAAPHARFLSAGARDAKRSRDAWRGHDVALLFPGSFRSAWQAWRAGIPRRVGWSRDGRGWLLTDRARPALERGGPALGTSRRGRFPRYLPRSVQASAQELLGFVGLAVEDPRPRLVIDPSARERVGQRLAAFGFDAHEAPLVVNVGARPGSAKGVPAELWADALGAIGREGRSRTLLVCGPGEESAVEELAKLLRRRGIPSAAYVAPVADLQELCVLAEGSSLFLTADGGARHVAAACGARVLCVFGPTDPRHTAHALERTRGVRASVPCAPCHLERCPLSGDEHHRCMTAIEAGALVEAARRF